MPRPKLEMSRILWQERPECRYGYDYSQVVAQINQELGNERALLRILRYWCREDLFFLLYFVLKLDVHHSWLVDRIKEVQEENDRTLDLWPREHFKSTILTFGLNIREIVRNPEVRIGLFSHTRTIAKSFLRRIKHTFESSGTLKAVYPDILWQDPQRAAPKWSEDEGITVIRKGIYQEQSIEAWGLTDGMPTSKHFDILHYDDVVTRDSVTTPEQIAKTDECFNLSGKLGASDLLSGKDGRRRVVGTVYHFNDLYMKLAKRGTWVVRKYPVQREDGSYIFFTPEQAAEKRKEDGPYVWATQMMLDPREEGKQRFRYEWLQYYDTTPTPVSKYLLVDPATSKKEKGSGSDYTVMWLWGVDSRGNRFWLDGIRERLSLTEKWDALKELLERHPDTIRVGYEKYGMQTDVEYFRVKMVEEAFYFPLQELGGAMKKEDRILRMVPWFENGKIWIPKTLYSRGRDLVQEFINEEYLFFPFASHDDFLDCASRIEDVEFIVSRPIAIPGGDPQGVLDFGWHKAKKESRFANL